MSSTYKLTSKAGMLTAFPDKIEKDEGEPDLRNLLRCLRHIMCLAQSYETKDNNGLNLLHIALQEEYSTTVIIGRTHSCLIKLVKAIVNCTTLMRASNCYTVF